MAYNDALNNVLEYEECLGLNIPADTEVELLRQYLIRDMRILSTLLKLPNLSELRDCEKFSIEEIMNFHKNYSRTYINLVESNIDFYIQESAIGNLIFAKVVNFYLLGIYERYAIDEEQALEFISKMTGLPKEELIELKKQADFNLSREISTGISPFLKRIREKNSSDKK